MTDNEIKALDAEDVTFGDALMHHFSEWGRWDWVETSEEALRVYNLVLGKEEEEDSPIDAITSAAVGHAKSGAYKAVAAALGVNAFCLEAALEAWYDNQDNLPAPVSAERLMEMIAEKQVELDAVESGAAA